MKSSLKALLLNPYLVTKANTRVHPVEPLGLLYMATYAREEIKKCDYPIQVEILDAQLAEGDETILTPRGYRSGLSDEELVYHLKKSAPDIIGLSNNYTAHTQDIIEIARFIRSVLPQCQIVVGGAHATIGHEDMIKEYPELDYVIRGEGEVTFFKLLEALYLEKPCFDVPGLSWRNNGNVVVNAKGPILTELDDLPIPDRSLIPYKRYLDLSKKTYFLTMKSPVGTMFTSRGCMFKCIFCSTQKVWTNQWRTRSAANIVKEIEYLYNEWGVREFCFQDDQFMGSKQRVIEMCKLLVAKKLDISLIAPPGITSALMTEECLKWMRRAGFYRICYSVDVGTDRSQKYVKKPVVLDKVRDLVKKTNRLGFWTYATFVIGFPDETEEEVLECIKFAHSLKVDFTRFYVAQPHLGSKLYEIYEHDGLLVNKKAVENYHDIFDAMFDTKHISAKRLKELRDIGEDTYLKKHVRHLFNPVYFFQEFLPKIFGFKQFGYLWQLLVTEVLPSFFPRSSALGVKALIPTRFLLGRQVRNYQ